MNITYDDLRTTFTEKTRELPQKWRREQNPAESNQIFGQMMGLITALELLPLDTQDLQHELKEMLKSYQWDY